MADKTGFTHIRVTAAEEDEVIRAGVRADEGGDEADDGLLGVDVEVARDLPEDGEVGRGRSAGVGESGGTRSAEAAPKAHRRDAASEEAYRETTLDDLRPEPMSATQKTVIIAAIVLIIGALVYYFVVMR